MKQSDGSPPPRAACTAAPARRQVTYAGADFVGGVAGLSGGALRVGGSALGLAAHAVVNPVRSAWGTARGASGLAGGAVDLMEHTQVGAPLHALHAAGSRLLGGGTIRQSLAAGGHAGLSALDPESPEMRQYYARLGTRATDLAHRAGAALQHARGVDIGDVTGRVVGNLALGAVGGESGAATEAAAAERAVLAEQAGAGRAAAAETAAAAAERASLPPASCTHPPTDPSHTRPPRPPKPPPATPPPTSPSTPAAIRATSRPTAAGATPKAPGTRAAAPSWRPTTSR